MLSAFDISDYSLTKFIGLLAILMTNSEVDNVS